MTKKRKIPPHVSGSHGGSAVRAKYGIEFYKTISAMAAEARQKKAEAKAQDRT